MAEYIKFGIINDIHYAINGRNYGYLGGARRVTTADYRFSQFIDVVNIENPSASNNPSDPGTLSDCSFAICLGDAHDSLYGAENRCYSTETDLLNNYYATLQAFNYRASFLVPDFYTMIGNHEKELYTGIGNFPGIEVFFDNLTSMASVDNAIPRNSTPLSYTFEKNGIRFVVLYAPLNSIGFDDPSVDDYLGWVQNVALNTNLPCVIFSHTRLQPSYTSIGGLNGQFYVLDYATSIQPIIDKAKNVQVCFNGHWHPGDYSIVNDIPYIGFYGSAKVSNDVDNAFYIVEIKPNSLYTPNGMKSNIKITGYSLGSLNSQDYTKYYTFYDTLTNPS